MTFQLDVDRVVTKEHGITQIGNNIRLNLGDPGSKRETIQRWFAPWLFIDWMGKRSQPTILSSFVAIQGCGLWLLDTVLPTWLSSSQDGIWLTGEVGCGKSILSSFVIKHLTEARQNNDSGQIVVPLIFSYNDDYTHTADFMPNTILAYLSSVEPIPKGIITARETHVSPSTIVNVEDVIINVITTLGEATSAKPNVSVVLVIDALDEIPPEPLVTNLEFLNKLMAVKNTGCGVRVRVVLFTRHDDRLQPFCRSGLGWQKTVIPRSDVDEDIRTAVTARLDKGTRLTRAEKKDLADQIVAKAEGMFRLASLYVDDLLKGTRPRFITRERLEALLEELPPDIDTFYDRILSRIPKGQVKNDVFKALRWIMFAARSFWVEDLVEACTIFSSSGVLFQYGRQEQLLCLDLVERLSGLVRIQPPLSEAEQMVLKRRTHVVTLAHFSVSEYLQRLDTACHRLDVGFFDRHCASLFLSQACFIYLMEASEQSRNSPERTTLTEYADLSWSSHVAACLQTLSNSQYAYQTTTIPLSFKIRNSIEFPNLIMYDDCEILRRYVRSIAEEILDPDRCNVLLDDILRNTDHQTSLEYDYNSEQSCNTSWEYDASLYTPLEPGCFRLLVIHPAERHLLVQCSLLVDYLENKAKYDYLSYHWGQSSRDRLITVNRRPLKTMLNLSKALVGLRNNKNPVLLWVDNICIDQSSITERNYQVAMMGDFVNHASNTLAWLPEDYSIYATSFLHHLYSQAYWHRRWILQELILAQDIRLRWGQLSLTWSDLMRLVDEHTHRLNEGHDQMQSAATDGTVSAISFFAVLQELRASRRAKVPLPNLEEILYVFRNNLCSLPSDMLYAILPLLNNDDKNLLPTVDYSFEASYTMIDLATVLLNRAQNYHIFSMVSSETDNYSSTLPSWVPTWTNIEDHPLAPGHAIPKQSKLYGASTKKPWFRMDIPLLYTKGWLIDDITYVAKIPVFVNNERWTSAERDILVRVVLEDRVRESPLSVFQRMNMKSLDWFAAPSEPSRLMSELRARGSRANRCIATTFRELLANVPAHTKVGDIIVILDGAEVPYILRPYQEACYGLIGECYVDGYMDGQAMIEKEFASLKSNSESGEVERFKIV